jgi:hypothetical protein
LEGVFQAIAREELDNNIEGELVSLELEPFVVEDPFVGEEPKPSTIDALKTFVAKRQSQHLLLVMFSR